MRTSKRVILSCLVFILLFVLLSAAVQIPWRNSEYSYYLDHRVREDLAGKIDFIVVGASHGLTAFEPRTLDEELGSVSYNLCGSQMPIYNRSYMLRKEMDRNPVKTVVLEIAYDALFRQQTSDHEDGDSITLLRLHSPAEEFKYLTTYVSADDWLNIYCRHMNSALQYWKDMLFGEETNHIDHSAKGYHKRASIDITIPDEQIVTMYGQSEKMEPFREDNVSQFYELIETCKQAGCRVVVVSTPLSNKMVWEAKDLDLFKDRIDEICENADVPYYNFDLLKGKDQILNDAVSYSDDVHMSYDGAIAFSRAFCDCMKEIDAGADLEELFYSDYAEAKEHSPYMDYYRAHTEN